MRTCSKLDMHARPSKELVCILKGLVWHSFRGQRLKIVVQVASSLPGHYFSRQSFPERHKGSAIDRLQSLRVQQGCQLFQLPLSKLLPMLYKSGLLPGACCRHLRPLKRAGWLAIGRYTTTLVETGLKGESFACLLSFLEVCGIRALPGLQRVTKG